MEKTYNIGLIARALRGCLAALFATNIFSAQFSLLSTTPVSGSRTGISVSWVDFNEDNWVDLYITTDIGAGGNLLFRNEGNGSFSSLVSTITADIGTSQGSVWADSDNDGDLDLFIPVDANRPNYLYRNDRTNFTRLTVAGLIVTEQANSVAASWGDFDNDGLVDLFVANGGIGGGQANSLHKNLGSNQFSKITTTPLASGQQYSISGSWADYDADGDLDLFVANGGGRKNQLFRNNGGGQFTGISSDPVVQDGGSSMGGVWGDYDNDGRPDLFVVNFSGGSNFLYHNNGDGSFTKSPTGTFNEGTSCTDAVWGDYDNDGFVDLFVSTVGVDLLYRNRGDGTFVKILDEPLTSQGGYTIGCAWGDFNKDGFLDLALANWQGAANALFQNAGNTNKWLKVRCIGEISNRAAIGTQLRLVTSVGATNRVQWRQIEGGSGYGTQNEQIAHFGLGGADRVLELRLLWPSGVSQVLTNIQANQQITITESRPTLTMAPEGGEFTNSVSVTLRGSSSDSEIRYTIDGSDPQPASTVYSGPITVSASVSLKAAEFRFGQQISVVSTGIFTEVFTSTDGIPDSWRAEFFGAQFRTDQRAAPEADPDADGFNNLAEYNAGTNPLDSVSKLEVSLKLIPSVSWYAFSNRFYRVFRKESASATNAIPLTVQTQGTGKQETFLDFNAPNRHGFYYIEVSPRSSE